MVTITEGFEMIGGIGGIKFGCISNIFVVDWYSPNSAPSSGLTLFNDNNGAVWDIGADKWSIFVGWKTGEGLGVDKSIFSLIGSWEGRADVFISIIGVWPGPGYVIESIIWGSGSDNLILSIFDISGNVDNLILSILGWVILDKSVLS